MSKTKQPKIVPAVVPKQVRAQIKQKIQAVSADQMPYLKCILNPGETRPCGIPDSLNVPTALYRTKRVMDIYADFGTSSASGRFSIACSPKLGSPASPENYNLAITSFQDASLVDFTSPSAYESFVSGVDPRIDDNCGVLTMNAPAFWGVTGSGGTNTTPFTGGTVTLSNRNYGADIDIIDGNSLRLPIGTWLITSTLRGASGMTLTHTYSNAGSLSGYTRTSTDGTQVSEALYVEVTNSSNAMDWVIAGTGFSSLDVSIAPARFANANWLESFGLVKKIRPVACSALFTYANTSLMNGGRVSGHLVPGDTLADNFFTNNPVNNGQYQLWERLAQCPGAYSGPIKDGTYVFYTPDTDLDYQLRSPDEANYYDYPAIVISGEFNPGSLQTGRVSVGRLEVITVYEFTTTSTLFETYVRPGSHAVMDSYAEVLASIPRSMPNGVHWDNIKGWLSKAGKVLWNKREDLIKAARLLAPVATMLF